MTAKKRQTVKGLRVVAKSDGFRRAGREWTGSTDVPLSDFTGAQIEQLRREPQLVVVDCEIDVAEQDSGDA